MSFTVIGWRSSAFTSWKWELQGKWGDIQRVGFHVMALCCSGAAGWKRVRDGAKLWHFHKAERPDIHWCWQMWKLTVSRLLGTRENLGRSISGFAVPQPSGKTILRLLWQQALISKRGLRPAGKRPSKYIEELKASEFQPFQHLKIIRPYSAFPPFRLLDLTPAASRGSSRLTSAIPPKALTVPLSPSWSQTAAFRQLSSIASANWTLPRLVFTEGRGLTIHPPPGMKGRAGRGAPSWPE